MKLGSYTLGPNNTPENGIYIGDAERMMRSVPTGSVSAIVTDPPYGSTDGRGKVTKRGDKLVEFGMEWDKVLPLTWISEAVRVLKDGCWFAAFTDKLSVKAVWDAFEDAGGHGKQTFYWVKTNPTPQPRKNWSSGVETAVLGTKGVVKQWFGGGWYPNYIFCPIVSNQERVDHPTQKPLKVMRYLMLPLVKSGDIVIDPFVGSGTTAVVCKEMGLRYLGFEIDPEMAKLARHRICQTQPIQVDSSVLVQQLSFDALAP